MHVRLNMTKLIKNMVNDYKQLQAYCRYHYLSIHCGNDGQRYRDNQAVTLAANKDTCTEQSHCCSLP